MIWLKNGALELDSQHKGSDALTSGLIVDAEKVKPSVFLLVGSRKGIRPYNLAPNPLLGNSMAKLANSGLLGKWPLKLVWCVCRLKNYFWTVESVTHTTTYRYGRFCNDFEVER